MSKKDKGRYSIRFTQEGAVNVGTQNINTSPSNSHAETVKAFAKAVLTDRPDLDLDVERAQELATNLEVLRTVAEDGDLSRPEVRSAGRAVVNIASGLSLGVGGNALWEAFKAAFGL